MKKSKQIKYTLNVAMYKRTTPSETSLLYSITVCIELNDHIGVGKSRRVM